jgi:hypothetical protein
VYPEPNFKPLKVDIPTELKDGLKSLLKRRGIKIKQWARQKAEEELAAAEAETVGAGGPGPDRAA